MKVGKTRPSIEFDIWEELENRFIEDWTDICMADCDWDNNGDPISQSQMNENRIFAENMLKKDLERLNDIYNKYYLRPTNTIDRVIDFFLEFNLSVFGTEKWSAMYKMYWDICDENKTVPFSVNDFLEKLKLRGLMDVETNTVKQNISRFITVTPTQNIEEWKASKLADIEEHKSHKDITKSMVNKIVKLYVEMYDAYKQKQDSIDK